MGKQHRKRSIANTIIYYIAIGVLIVCVGIFAKNIYDSYQTKKNNEKLQEIYYSETVNSTTDETDNSSIISKFEPLIEINPETVGWITVPNTTANLVVVQKKDEEIGNEYYLKHNFFNEDSESGAIFMDRRNIATETETSDNIILYGHNQADETMFGDLKKYKDIEFYKENPVITFSTLYDEKQYKIISYFVIDIEPSHGEIFDYHNYINFDDEEEFNYYISEIMARSYMLNDVDVEYGDKFLTLSTCSNEFSTSRFVIIARQVREGESSEVDISSVTKNPNIKRDSYWNELFG